MGDRAKEIIDEILSAEPKHILPLQIEKQIKDIAQRAVVSQMEKA
jgi:hypothetical protein